MTLRPIYYDTETTGVRPEQDRIVEIAAFDPERKREFSQLVNPQIPIPKEAVAIHHISDEMVASAPTFKEVAESFISFCGEGAVLIAHNNDNFDRHFLAAEAKRAGISLPDYQMIDSLKWSRKYRPDLPRHSLQFLRQIYGVSENKAHRALDDVIVLSQVFSQMIDDLPITTVLELLSANEGNTMPFGKHQGKPLESIPPNYVKWLEGQGVFNKAENSTLKAAFEKLGVLK